MKRLSSVCSSCITDKILHRVNIKKSFFDAGSSTPQGAQPPHQDYPPPHFSAGLHMIFHFFGCCKFGRVRNISTILPHCVGGVGGWGLGVGKDAIMYRMRMIFTYLRQKVSDYTTSKRAKYEI